jgi:hypothetical protein
MRTALLALLGLVLGFFAGEVVAATFGMISFAAFDGTPFGPVLWILRSLPIVCALAGAVAAVAVANRRRSG